MLQVAIRLNVSQVSKIECMWNVKVYMGYVWCSLQFF